MSHQELAPAEAGHLDSGAKQATGKNGLHATAVVSYQMGEDLVARDAANRPIRFEEGLAKLFDTKPGQLFG